MSDGDRLRKLIDEFNQELCWAGCGVKCETREERRRLEAKVKDRYAQAIAAMFDERIAALEALVMDMYGYAVNREMELCNFCTCADGEYSDCAACDDCDGACGVAKKRFEELYALRILELGVEK